MFFKSKEKECKGYELLTEECLETHKSLFHGDQEFKDGLRPIEHRCTLEKGKLNCRNLIETDIGANMEGRPKYMDERGEAHQDIESFRNRSKLPEIEMQKLDRDRHGDKHGRASQIYG